MSNQKTSNIKLGLFVLIGTIFIITGLYFIGDNQNLFGSKFRISADFRDVNGLMAGNNVRYAGINIGTVEKIKILNDSSIRVEMVIRQSAKEFIRKNAIATIGTDGMMGNKLVNIQAGKVSGEIIENGDILQTLSPVATSDMLRTLDQTNEDISVIVKNLRNITEKLNSPNSLWHLMLDTVFADNVRQAIVNIKVTSQNSATITGDLSRIVADIKAGKGTIGALITDTTLSNNLKQTIINIKVVSDTLGYITGDLRTVSQSLRHGEGAIGTILMDTAFAHDLNKSMENLRKGSEGFNENMEALKHSIFLRRYFRKQEKEQGK
jgi:phospholipid/cholesterol/gamma-HCH transport system substrate-binding protein